MIAVLNSLAEAQIFVAAHPGAQCAYLSAVSYDPSAPVFATAGEVIAYLIENIGATATWNLPPLTTAASILYPGPTLPLAQLAADLTTLRAAVADQGSFVGISTTDATPIQAGLAACINDTNALLQSAETFLSSSQGVANVIAGGIDYLMAQQFELYLNVAAQAPDILDMQSFLTRMAANLEAETAAYTPAMD